MTVDLWMTYMPMLVSMNVTLMQGHSGSANPKNHRCMISATISIKLSTTVGHFYVTLTFANVYMVGHLVFRFLLFSEGFKIASVANWYGDVGPVNKIQGSDLILNGNRSDVL